MATTKKFTNLSPAAKTEYLGRLTLAAISHKRCFELGNEMIAIGESLGVYADQEAQALPIPQTQGETGVVSFIDHVLADAIAEKP